MSYELFRPRGSDSLTTSDSNEFNVLTPSASYFDISLYQNRAEATKIDKTEFLTYITTVSGALRTETSLQAPTIIIEYSRVPNFNYCHIQSFGRYYFIRNITSINNNLWQIELNCDVLFSFRANIMQLNAYVARNELKFTPQIPDDKYKMSDIYTQTIIDPTIVNGIWFPSDSYVNQWFLMQVQGKFKTSAGVAGVDIPLTEPVATLALSYGTYKNLINAVNSASSALGGKTIADCLISTYSIPCGLSLDNTAVHAIDIPGFLSTDIEITGDDVKQPNILYAYTTFVFDLRDYLEDIDDINEYKNTPPYKTITLEFNPFGTYEIPYSEIRNSGKLYIKVKVNIISGDAVLFYGGDSNPSIYLGSSNVAIRFPFTSQVYNANASQHAANALTIAGGIIAKKPEAIVAGAASEINAITNSLNPSTSVTSGAFQYIQQPRIYIRDIAQQEPNTTLYGRPYYKNANLTELSGYTEIERIHIEDIPNATIDEAQEIERLLKSGVII